MTIKKRFRVFLLLVLIAATVGCDRVTTSVITSKAANGYHVKTGHSTSVRDKSFYSFIERLGKRVFVP